MTEQMDIAQDGDIEFRVSEGGFGERLRFMQGTIDFVAASWWRRTLIKLISGGRIEFFK